MEFTFTRPTDGAQHGVVFSTASAPATAAGAANTQDRTTAGSLLVDLFQYLSANAERHPVLADAISVLSSAVAEYRTGQAADPLAGPRRVFGAIQAARLADQSLPVP
jgi:hypothetical protein